MKLFFDVISLFFVFISLLLPLWLGVNGPLILMTAVPLKNTEFDRPN